MSRGRVVYGVVGEGLVFIPYDIAQELAMLRRGFATWIEARQSVAPSRWLDIVERVEDEHGRTPNDDERYDPERIRGYSDGDWPEWPAQLMIEWMPASVLDQFGRSVDSTLSGAYAELDPSVESQVVAALEAEGWICIKDEALTLAASGY